MFSTMMVQIASISVVGLIILATAILAFTGKLNEGAIGILSGVAGYVLGGGVSKDSLIRKNSQPNSDNRDGAAKQRSDKLLGGFSVGLVLFGGDLFGGLLDGAHEGEEDYVADGAGVGEEHGEAVDAYAFACGGRKAVAEGSDVVFVHLVGFVVALFLLVELVEEALALVVGVV